MRLVLDTNVALSALLWRGKPHQLLGLIREQLDAHQLFSSEALMMELRDVLGRRHLAKPLAAIGRSPAQVLADYAAAVEIVTPTYIPRVVRDPDDDQVIACALTAQASLIVSGDQDLLTLKQHQGIDIFTAARALDRIRGAS